MSIHADGQDWTVKLTTEPIGGDTGERAFLGKNNEAENLIVIDGTMPTTRQEEVLIHELVHIKNRDLPEFIVADIGISMYGILRENDLLVGNLIDVVSDGTLTPEETAAINRDSNEMAEEPQMFFMRKVSESSWDGPVFDDDGVLSIEDASGRVNRNAAHLAVAQLAGARGGTQLSLPKRRAIARQLKGIYRDVLQEPIPQGVEHLLLSPIKR